MQLYIPYFLCSTLLSPSSFLMLQEDICEMDVRFEELGGGGGGGEEEGGTAFFFTV